MKTALIVVDAQNDFAHRKGALYAERGELVIPKINRLILQYVASDKPVYYSADAHPEKTSHFDEWGPHCIVDTWGAELHARLIIAGDTVYKGLFDGENGYSAFSYKNPDGKVYSTGLGEKLQDLGVEAVNICGYVSEVCVADTAISAAQTYQFKAVNIMTEACAALNPQEADRIMTSLHETYGITIVKGSSWSAYL